MSKIEWVKICGAEHPEGHECDRDLGHDGSHCMAVLTEWDNPTPLKGTEWNDPGLAKKIRRP